MKNMVNRDGRLLSVTPTDGGATSGSPGLLGQLGFVAETDQRTDNTVTADAIGVYNLSVQAINGSGNVAVAAGDIIYYVTANTPKLSKVATGVKFGIALAAITSGSTATIPVLLVNP